MTNSGRFKVLGACVLVTLCVVTAMAFRSAGAWLIVSDALQPSRAVVVFGGHLPFRAVEAANLYHDGWAEEVWVTTGGESLEAEALATLAIHRPEESEYSVRVLEALDVPHEVIRVLPERNTNTADEVSTLAREAARVGGVRVILVTSKYHTRRVRTLWRALADDDSEAIVRFTPDDPFEPVGWWRNTSDAMAVSREWFGILNARLGFPVTSER